MFKIVIFKDADLDSECAREATNFANEVSKYNLFSQQKVANKIATNRPPRILLRQNLQFIAQLVKAFNTGVNSDLPILP